ncbi:MAG: helix-turn-helix domain-containing protein, partial [Lachnospiraceae bacterium]|nr:helix-turn-helix domain-containing protein [Lachnospiraceae bacterium]
HRFSEAAALLEQWYGQVRWPSVEDVKWAMDYCRRMVLTVEEQYSREVKNMLQEMTVYTSAAACLDRCRELLTGMQRSYDNRYSSSIAAALEYIHKYYGNRISMAETARQVYRSPEYFSRQFKEEVGENFNTYLTLYRLERAQELLDRTDLRIEEIAEKVGYGTPGYFTRVYKKYKGITPEQAKMSKSSKKSQKNPGAARKW